MCVLVPFVRLLITAAELLGLHRQSATRLQQLHRDAHHRLALEHREWLARSTLTQEAQAATSDAARQALAVLFGQSVADSTRGARAADLRWAAAAACETLRVAEAEAWADIQQRWHDVAQGVAQRRRAEEGLAAEEAAGRLVVEAEAGAELLEALARATLPGLAAQALTGGVQASAEAVTQYRRELVQRRGWAAQFAELAGRRVLEEEAEAGWAVLSEAHAAVTAAAAQLDDVAARETTDRQYWMATEAEERCALCAVFVASFAVVHAQYVEGSRRLSVLAEEVLLQLQEQEGRAAIAVEEFGDRLEAMVIRLKARPEKSHPDGSKLSPLIPPRFHIE